MITYFYKFDYGNDATTPEEHVRVYIVADKYDVPDLKALAVRRFECTAPGYFDGLDACLPIVKLIYDNTTRKNQDIRIAAIVAWLRGSQNLKAEEQSKQLTAGLIEMPEFAAELATAYAQVIL